MVEDSIFHDKNCSQTTYYAGRKSKNTGLKENTSKFIYLTHHYYYDRRVVFMNFRNSTS